MGDRAWTVAGTGLSLQTRAGSGGVLVSSDSTGVWWSSTGVAETCWDLQLGVPRKAKALAGTGMVLENETLALDQGAE